MRIYILSAIVLLVLSFLLGSVIVDYCGLRKYGFRFTAPFGFFVMIALLQVCYYPIQITHGDSRLIHFSTMLVFFLIVMLAIIRRNSIVIQIKQLIKNKKQILFLLFIMLLCFVFYYKTEISLRTDDLTFYVPYISGNIHTEHLTVYNVQYDYQGYYHFIASIIFLLEKLNTIGFNYDYLPIGAITWIMAILFYFLLTEIMIDIYNIMNKNTDNHRLNLFLLLILVIYNFSFAWYLSQPYYGNTMRRINVILLIPLCGIISKDHNLKITALVSLLFGSLISFTSTGFFFSAMIIYCLLLYFMNSKSKNYIEQIALISIFPAIFMVLFIKSKLISIFVILLYLVYFVFKIFHILPYIEKYLNKFSAYFFIGVPMLFTIVPFLPFYVKRKFNSGSFELENYNFFDPHAFESVPNYLNFSVYNVSSFIRNFFFLLIWLAVIYFLYNSYKKSKLSFLPFYLFTMFLTFFNPVVFQFVADNITNVVYFRIYDLIFNSFTLFALFYYLIKDFKKPMLIGVLLLIFVINELTFNPVWWSIFSKKDEDFNPLYHTSNKEIEVLEEFTEKFLSPSDKPIIIASQIYSTESLTTANLKNTIKNFADLDGMIKFNDFDHQFQRVFYRRSPAVEDIGADYLKACEFAKEKDVEYVILDAQYNWELETGIGYCGEKLFEMHNYRIFKMHYDWLKE